MTERYCEGERFADLSFTEEAFEDCDFTDCVFVDCSFTKCELDHTTLNECKFVRCEITGLRSTHSSVPVSYTHLDVYKRQQRYSTLSLGLLDSPNLAAGIAGVKLVEPVLNARKIVV